MSTAAVGMVTASQAMEAFTRRSGPANALAGDAEAIAAACHAMAERFHRGGRLVVFGSGGSGSDAAHVVVEFVHPVIVGKKALPAFSLTGPNLAAQLALLAEPADIALGISAGDADAELTEAMRAARRSGLLTVALLGGDGDRAAGEGIAGGGIAEHTLVVRSDDPLVVKEVQVTTYHVLWELVHVFAEQPGALA
ncbi:MAG TPA: SIS domain-containing protein [Pseudonocardia sp.]|jgi:D-sedoheptulose 7-phosphate isomerase|uniref:SIS domain-containing protein n=1 Tax=Pseudonocardia sp. TaxID=60912 RepID=UPI002CF82B9D|nr:SIS domain-containing protein [Pseudonocardia sp.]HTF46993.1 SIS domain-containing protein [Pseudonocardia sp.]